MYDRALAFGTRGPGPDPGGLGPRDQLGRVRDGMELTSKEIISKLLNRVSAGAISKKRKASKTMKNGGKSGKSAKNGGFVFFTLFRNVKNAQQMVKNCQKRRKWVKNGQKRREYGRI